MPNRKPTVPPPPSKTRLAVSAPPPPQETPDNLSKGTESIQDLNFKVESGFHRRFKMTAVARGMSMKELLEAAFECWVERYGEMPPDSDDLFKRR
jgi:hypothetical protein